MRGWSRRLTLSSLIILLFLSGCVGKVDRVVDGDTLIVDGERVRLVGVNTPERGEAFYEEAKEFTEGRVDGEWVILIVTGKDRYKRSLGLVLEDEGLLNLDILDEGMGNAYYFESPLWPLFLEAEREAYEGEKGMWKRSPWSACLNVSYAGDCSFLVKNACDRPLNLSVIIRDATASHRFPASLSIEGGGELLIEEDCQCNGVCLCKHIFNKEGDELIILDGDGVLAKASYGVYSRNGFEGS